MQTFKRRGVMADEIKRELSLKRVLDLINIEEPTKNSCSDADIE